MERWPRAPAGSSLLAPSHPLNFSSCDDPAVEVAEDKAHKEALERQESGLNHVEHLHKIEAVSEEQDWLHHRCEQLAKAKDQHQGDEIL